MYESIKDTSKTISEIRFVLNLILDDKEMDPNEKRDTVDELTRIIVEMAKNIGGNDHGFKFIQLPYNMNYDQALLGKNQLIQNKPVSILESAVTLGVGVFTSVPFMQGRLLSPGVMPEFSDLKPSLRALQFIRSSPGVLAPLVGQKSSEHVAENLEIMNVPPMSDEDFLQLVKKLTS